MSWDRPNYAIPGLMPEGSPNYEAEQRTNPDGSPYSAHQMDAVVAGDWWEGESFDITYSGGNPGTLELVRITMRRGSTQGDVGITWTSEASGLTITEANTWSFEIDPHNVTLGPGEWYGDVECTNDSGEVYTPFTIVLPIIFDGTQ